MPSNRIRTPNDRTARARAFRCKSVSAQADALRAFRCNRYCVERSQPKNLKQDLVDQRDAENAEHKPSNESLEDANISRDAMRGNIAETKCSVSIYA
jgi:hypothetical protein